MNTTAIPSPAVNGNGKEPVGAVLVVGGGVAGIQASLDLSAAGFRVYCVEQSATIGGGMARLDKTFPTGDCATCIISPKLVEFTRNHNIDTLTLSDVTALEGEPGRFRATVLQRPRSVDIEKCTGCGDCLQACPVRNVIETPEPFQPGQHLDDADDAELGAILARHKGDPGAVMPILQDVRRAYGYLPRPVLEHVASRLEVPLAAILRVASFYGEFGLEPVGRHIVEVCTGTSCYAQGSGALLERLEEEIGVPAGETSRDRRFTLRTVRCLGLCALSPAMKVDGQSFGRVNPDRVAEILEPFE